MLLISELEEYMLPCLSKKYLGIECMGCGLQRSLALLMQGEFVAAFKMYPAIYPLVLLFIIIGINTFKPSKYRYKAIVLLGIISATVIVGSFIMKTFIIK
ncbi:DUF2752 domain-containing protein [Hyunsoonleella pacifica]|uniref:DUF2752 domain-containing protein n=1 Tax=Hyunsoonleella pacifica TaxID=1080224 RepID=A0A4Q9FR61_9FLAO|nr:DUF2752 domain-containing protein [Hyunsoonleella pacifica]TBN17880.1 DUF2752 domain-containing protein [Hyunsoonleella pacifica]GGD08115.1 hypothetical protein GCM10011368_07620 [Hyunsoonleella pacifica]